MRGLVYESDQLPLHWLSLQARPARRVPGLHPRHRVYRECAQPHGGTRAGAAGRGHAGGQRADRHALLEASTCNTLLWLVTSVMRQISTVRCHHTLPATVPSALAQLMLLCSCRHVPLHPITLTSALPNLSPPVRSLLGPQRAVALRRRPSSCSATPSWTTWPLSSALPS